MIPSPSDRRWESVLSGEKKVKIKAVTLSMMLSRLNRQYAKDPGKLSDYAQEAYDFCKKYEKVFEEDFKLLF